MKTKIVLTDYGRDTAISKYNKLKYYFCHEFDLK